MLSVGLGSAVARADRAELAVIPFLGAGGYDENELGSFIRHLQKTSAGVQRCLLAAAWFCDQGVKFHTECFDVHAESPKPPFFSAFDCTTFMYSVNALAHSRDVSHYFAILDSVRYTGARGKETLVHYTLNCLRRFEEAGLVKEVTQLIVDPGELKTKSVVLDRLPEGKWFLPHLVVGDENRGAELVYSYIPSQCWSSNMPNVHSGDTLIFVSAKPVAAAPFSPAGLRHPSELGTADAHASLA